MGGAMVDCATQTLEIGSEEEEEEELELKMEMEMGSRSPRVVIDTSPPFSSVEEAVIRFGGRGFWIPHHLLPPHTHSSTTTPTQPYDPEKPDIYKLEDRAATMLKNLHLKEQETLEIMKELELTKHLVEELKSKLPKDIPEPECMPTSGLAFDNLISALNKEYHNKDHTTKQEDQSNSIPKSTAGLIMMELKQAKHTLYQNTTDLAAIRASVESLSEKMEKEKVLVEKAQETKPMMSNSGMRNISETLGGSINPSLISRELQELNYEAEQFMKTAEAARSEVLKAMSDVEKTKTGLKVIEMRWVAAKKLDEAAKAAESLALAEIGACSSNDNVGFEGYQQRPRRIILSLEEYNALTEKVRKAESLDDPFKKIEEATEEKLRKMSLEEVLSRVEVMNRRKVSNDEALGKPFGGAHSNFRNSFQSRPRRDSRLIDANEFESNMKNETKKPVLRPTTSIGDILSRKLVVRDDFDVGRQEENESGRQRVSLNQMLSQQRRETSPITRREKEGGDSKKFFKRKAMRFVHISLPLSKPSKNKIQAMNLW